MAGRLFRVIPWNWFRAIKSLWLWHIGFWGRQETDKNVISTIFVLCATSAIVVFVKNRKVSMRVKLCIRKHTATCHTLTRWTFIMGNFCLQFHKTLMKLHETWQPYCAVVIWPGLSRSTRVVNFFRQLLWNIVKRQRFSKLQPVKTPEFLRSCSF